MWGWVCGCLNKVGMKVTGCGGGFVGGGVGWVCVWGVGGSKSEFWTSGIVYANTHYKHE